MNAINQCSIQTLICSSLDQHIGLPACRLSASSILLTLAEPSSKAQVCPCTEDFGSPLCPEMKGQSPRLGPGALQYLAPAHLDLGLIPRTPPHTYSGHTQGPHQGSTNLLAFAQTAFPPQQALPPSHRPFKPPLLPQILQGPAGTPPSPGSLWARPAAFLPLHCTPACVHQSCLRRAPWLRNWAFLPMLWEGPGWTP